MRLIKTLRSRAVSLLAVALCMSPCAFAESGGTAQETTLAASDIVARMQEAMAPAGTELAKIRLSAEAPDGATTVYHLFSARRAIDGQTHTTLLFRDGNGFDNTVMSWGTVDDGQFAEALFLPHEDRVREVVPVMANTPFLRTDFTRADLGLVDPGERTYTLLGTEQIDHQTAYKIQATLTKPEYYSRIVTWVSSDTYLPLRQEYFDRADRLWKVARYQGIVVDDHPTITSITLNDVQSQTTSELVKERVYYSAKPNETLFRAATLAEVPAHKAWAPLESVLPLEQHAVTG